MHKAQFVPNENVSSNSSNAETNSSPTSTPTSHSVLLSSKGDCSGNSFSKVVLVDLMHNQSKLRCYCIIDDQSSSSFIDPLVLEHFNATGNDVDYTISTMMGRKTLVRGKTISGLSVKGVTKNREYRFPPINTSEYIPQCQNEVATPKVVSSNKYIAHYASNFSEFDSNARVLLLLGRDSGNVMGTRCYGAVTPFVHNTALGWCLVGITCTCSHTLPLNVLRTSVFGM